MRDNSYTAVMARKNEIMKRAVGMDYDRFESGSIAFDYEAMMAATGYSLEAVRKIQTEEFQIGNTPLIELKNLTALARSFAPAGYGARIFVKDEAANLSGSFKVRRAATSIHQAKRMGYKGVISATSGNYGAAVAACAAKAGLKCIVVQECFDSKGIGQPEIIEKARKCEALGAEDAESYKTETLRFLAAEYAKRGWAMELHIGPMRNNNTRMFNRLGPDAGFDSIGDDAIAGRLSRFLDSMAVRVIRASAGLTGIPNCSASTIITSPGFTLPDWVMAISSSISS